MIIGQPRTAQNHTASNDLDGSVISGSDKGLPCGKACIESLWRILAWNDKSVHSGQGKAGSGVWKACAAFQTVLEMEARDTI
jgi:hypothetical protein